MFKIAFGLLIAALPLTAVHAQAMPVSTFLAKADALKKKGPLALFSGDIKVLKREINGSAKAYGAEIGAAKKTNSPQHSCPPKSIKLSPGDILGHFNSIPPAQRNMSVKTAFYGMMKKRYPCPS
jgi:hypothetical protein